LNDDVLHWAEVSPVDSPLFFGSTQLERYVLLFGTIPRGIELVFWHHDGAIQNAFFPSQDPDDTYTIELTVTRLDDYNLLISRTDVKSITAARACVDLYKKLCTQGFDEEFS